MLSKSTSSDFDACSDFFTNIPSLSIESFFSVNDVSDPIEPSFFFSEFVLTTDLERVTTITTSARGDFNQKKDNKWIIA
jgi:hypothetical protein